MEDGSDEKMVEIGGRSAAAEGVLRVWTKIECGGEESVPILLGRAATDLLLGEKA